MIKKLFKSLILSALMLLPVLASAQVQTPIPGSTILGNSGATQGLAKPLTTLPFVVSIPTGGSTNICTQSSACFGDTMWLNETSLSCSGSPAHVTGLTSNGEALVTGLAPYVGAYAIVTGCGPASASNVVGGIPVINGGSGYAATTTANPLTGSDFIVLSGGTPVNGSTFTGDIDPDGILTVTGITGQLYMGTLIAGTGVSSTAIIRDFIQGPTLTTVPTGGNGTYQLTFTPTPTTATFSPALGTNAVSGTLSGAITNGVYTFKFSDKEKRTVTISGGTSASWTGALTTAGMTTATWGVIAEAMTGSNPTVVRVLATTGPLASVTNVSGFGTAGGPYTNISLTGGSGTGAIGTVTMTNNRPTSIAITTPGTGYVTGDNLAFTITGGSGVAHVATVTGNAVAFAGVVAGGQYSTQPGTGAGVMGTITGTGTAGGPYTGISLTGGAGTGAIATVTMNGTSVASVTITTPGSGYAVNNVLGCNTIPGGSSCSAKITATAITQSATSGSGSGATFAPTMLGLPIYGTVASLDSDSSFTFNTATSANTVTAVTNKSEQLVMGHNDDAAMTALLATSPSIIELPQTKKAAWVNTPLGYGFLNPIVLPSAYRVAMLCRGQRVVALAPQSVQITAPFQAITSLFYKPIIDNCDLQGMGVANYNYYISQASMLVQNGAAENATIENIFIGDAAGDNASDGAINGTRVHNDTNAVPAWPAYNYEISGVADNVANNVNMNAAIWGGMLINGADLQMGGTNHLFAYGAGPCYDVEATKAGIDGICDNPAPGQAGYFLNSGLTNLHGGWQVSLGSTFGQQFGVYVNTDSRDTIGCGTGANNAQWAGNYANLVAFNFTYSASSTTRLTPCSGNGNSTADAPLQTSNAWLHGDVVIDGSITVGGTNNLTSGAPLLQSAIPFGVPATTVWDATGDYVIGASPATSATITFGATSGATTATCSAACFNGANTTNDVNRVITVLDTTYKTCLVTGNSGSSTTVVQCTLTGTLSGVGPFSNANSWISGSGTAAQTNGAPAGANVTYPAALSNLYSGIYLYFSGTTAGPSQGIYWCVPASLATGTCYGGPNSPTYSTGNGTLTGSNKPLIPGSTSALTTTSGTNVPTTGSAIILPQATLLANTLGTAGCIDYQADGVNTNSATNTKSLSVRLNTSGPNNSMITEPINHIQVKMCNAGVTNSQVSVMVGPGGSTQNMQVASTSAGINRIAVSTTSNQTVSFAINLSNATDSFVLEDYYIKATPGP